MNETVTIPRAEYEALRAAAAELHDLRIFDQAKAQLTAGEEELIPAEVVNRILDGDAPLRAFREWRGLSGAELARRSGVNRVQILDIEAGRRAGSAATLKKLAEALGVSLDDLA